MSTTTTPVTTNTRSPVSRNSGTSLVINVPRSGIQVLCVDDTDSVHMSLERNGNTLTWYPCRALQRYSSALYVSIPIEIVNEFDLTDSDELDVTVYPNRVDYSINEQNTLVIKNTAPL